MNLSQMEFDDIAPREVPVRIAGEQYILAEASAGAAAAYDNRKMRGAKLDESGKVAGLDNLADLKPFAVSLCLRKASGEAVSEEWVRTLPDRIADSLYERLRELSTSLFGVPDVDTMRKQRDALNRAIDLAESKRDDPKG